MQEPHFLDDVEDEIAEFVHPIAPVGLHATDVDEAEVCVGGALFGRHPHLGRRGLVVELDPEGLKQFPCPFDSQVSVFDFSPEKRVEVLVESSGVEGIPGIQFRDDAQVDEPVGLQHFGERAWRVFGHVAAPFGDLEPFGPAMWICFPLRSPQCFVRVPFREGRKCIRCDFHREQFLPSIRCMGIGVRIEGGQRRADVGFETCQALAIDFVIENRMPGGPLLHELGKDTGLECRDPLRLYGLEDSLALCASGPERDHFLDGRPARLLVDRVRDFGPPVQDLEVVQSVAADFGIGGRGLGGWAPLPHDQFIVPQRDGLLFEDVPERQRATDGHRYAVGLPAAIEIRQEPCPLEGKGRLGSDASVAQTSDAIIHAYPPIRVSKGNPSKRRRIRSSAVSDCG